MQLTENIIPIHFMHKKELGLQLVCVQGLGFVGAAMATAIANARTKDDEPRYQVVGVDLPTDAGLSRVNAINSGVFPFPTADIELKNALKTALKIGNLKATTDESVYKLADVVVIDVALDIPFLENEPQLEWSEFETALTAVFSKVSVGTLVLLETTVPPGTSEKIVLPIMKRELATRGLDERSVYLAHSYERVMPGSDYLDSIINNWRVYAGYNAAAADLCEEFLSAVIDVKEYPLTRLASMTASETAKVMENTYRAMNIAFVSEWTQFAEAVGIDLFEVIDAISQRPTHSNIRVPGLGVGGYCLTKDPAFAPAAARQIYGLTTLGFPFSNLSLNVNNEMPLHSIARLLDMVEGDIADKSVLLLGISYRQDVGDTRYSPVEKIFSELEKLGAQVTSYDPYFDYWEEIERVLPSELPDATGFDVVIFCTPHKKFKEMDVLSWLGEQRPVILDTSNVLSLNTRTKCRANGVLLESIGRGAGL